MRKRLPVFLVALGAAFALMPATPSAAQQPAADQYKAVAEKAAAFLKKSQNEDGSWGKEPQNRGVTGLVVTGLIRTGTAPTDAPVAKAVKFVESLVNAKSGHIAGDDAKATLVNYTTSINVMALNAADKGDKYKAAIGNAVKYLKEYQWDDARGKDEKSDFFGGAGYAGDKSRPDLSNTAFFLEAMKEAGVSKDDPAFKKALVFVGRCQNLKSEFNTAPWAGKTNDGSFMYTGANGGENRRTDADPKDPTVGPKADMGGYGSMTYAGVKSMIYCGVGKDDPRMKKALEWVGKNYTLDSNPGMPEANSQRGAVLLLPHLREGDGRAGGGHVHRREGREARLACGPAGGAREAAEARRQFRERDGPLDGRRPEPRHRLRPDGAELLQEEVSVRRLCATGAANGFYERPTEVHPMGERKERVLPVLAAHGVIQRGTVIELLADVRPADAASQDPHLFRAVVEDPAGLQKSIRWQFDGQAYSLSELTRVLRDNHGATPNVPRYFSNWQRVGATESLHHEAERFPR